jgi:TolB protein
MKIKKTKVILIFAILITIIFNFSYAQEINWQEFTSEYDLMNEITKFANEGKETKNENVLFELSEKFQQESEKLNKEWEEKYFSLVNNIHTSNSNYDLYNSLKNSISYLEKSLKQVEDNITSVKNIYKNRLKAIPTAYLILSKIPIALEEAKADKLRKLMDLTKKYVADNFSSIQVFSDTEIKNRRVIKDIIEVIEAGRSESFESDPIWFVTEDNNFYLLQKYRLYPEFPEKSSIKGEGELSPSYEGASFYKIENEDDENFPARFRKPEIQKQIKNFIKDVSEFNEKNRNKIYEIDNEYPKIIDELLSKKTEIENELTLKKEELEKLSNNYSRDFEQELKDAEDALNSHVKSREVLVFTILSELEQTGRSVEDQFKELILQAYNDLINRAKSLRAYKFYRVENHILKSYNAEEFYDKVYATEYSMPVRRRAYREEEGGLNRLGVILALKVRFVSTKKYLYGDERKIRGEIIYASNKDGNYEIYSLNLQTKREVRLTENYADDYYPQASSDGKIVYTSREDGQEEIYIMDADGSNKKRLTNNSADDWQPFYSKVLNKIVFTSYRDKNAEIYIMDADGKNQIRLTNNNYDDFSPSISPDGKKIVFASKRGIYGNSDIYIMDIDGKNQKRLTYNIADDWGPVFSPDGKYIAFSSNRDGKKQIYIMDINGEKQRRITSNFYDDWSPAFSPDGKYIAFHSDRGGNGKIYVLDLETQTEIEIVKNNKNNWTPSWR